MTAAKSTAIALLASLAVGSLLMLAIGRAPGHVWWAMVTNVLGDANTFGQMLFKATALALTGLSVSIALDAGLFNIGAEGQVTAGVLACAVVGVALPAGTPWIVAVPLCSIAAALAGAAVGGIIGVLRVTRNAHEVITSIMFNFIIGAFALWVGNVSVFQHGLTRGSDIVEGAQLPQLPLHESSANVSIVVAAAAVAGVWWLRARTTWGRAWRVVGQSVEAARATGVNVGRVQMLVLAGAGALAGLTATNLVMGSKHAYEYEMGKGLGFLGISAALLGRLHPVGIAGAALLLAFLSTGGLAVGREVPKELTEMLQGVVILAVAAAAAWERRLRA